jgi:hypothetical protein
MFGKINDRGCMIGYNCNERIVKQKERRTPALLPLAA